jgi:hypothetical protein
METIQNIKGQLATMSTEELKSLKSAIVSQLNYRFGNELAEAKRNLYIGTTCTVDHPKAYGKQFRVEKINPKNVVCSELGNGRKWTITASMLNIVK